MEKENSMTGEESLLLIQRMINTAKENLEDNSYYFLLWGWLVFTACLIHYFQIQFNMDYQGIGWAILMPLGMILSSVNRRRMKQKEKVRSYINDVMKYVMIAFLFSLFYVLFFMSKIGLATYPLIMVIYGIWLFIWGGALKFTPLIIGGIINWALAIVSIFLGFEFQLLLLALAVLLGYIIPGYLLKKKFNHDKMISETK